MDNQSYDMTRRLLPLILTFIIVLAGFSLIVIRHNNFRFLEHSITQQTQNLVAQKDLGKLIASDLEKITRYFYMILISVNPDQQKNLLNKALLTSAEIQDALNILLGGGTLSSQLPLNLPDNDNLDISITFTPINQQHDNLEVQALQPQLVDLENKLKQSIDMTITRNHLIKNPQGRLLSKSGLQLRSYAKTIVVQIERMKEHANKLTYDANQKLLLSQRKLAEIREQNQQTELFWVVATIFCVAGFIGLVYRQILFLQKKLVTVETQLQQAENKLQEGHSRVLSLNQTLEEQVAGRTEELRLSEKQWSDAFNAVNSPIFIHDQEGKIIRANTAYLKLASCSLAQASKYHYWEVFPKLDTPLPSCSDNFQETGETVCTKEQDVVADGVIYRSQSFVINDSQGNYLYSIHLMEDVTEREKYIEKLKRYEQILSTNTDLIAFFDKNHVFLAANSVYAEYYGIDPDEIVGKQAKDVVGVDRYQGYLKYHDMIFVEKKILHFKSWVDYPVKGKCHMAISFTPHFEADGTVNGFVSRSRDITEISEQEARLRLSAKVFESTSEGITITDNCGNILAVNSAFSQITGYTETEVIGKNPRILQSGRHDEIFYQHVWQQLARTGQWRGEIWNKRKNGEIYPEFLTISSVKDDSEKTINYVAVFSDITTIKKATEQLEFQAHHHPLTGLPNRLLLNARLKHTVQHEKREKGRGAVLFIDLDNFKEINDTLGHNAGDEVLKEVALRLQKDSRDVDTVAHPGGDEFVIVLHKIHTLEDAVCRADNILESLRQPFFIDGYELYIGGSIGIAEFSGEYEDIESLLKNADAAMYEAKNAGKNCYKIYAPEVINTANKKPR